MSSYVKISAYVVSLYLWYRLRHHLNELIGEDRDQSSDGRQQHSVLFFPETHVKSQDFYHLNCGNHIIILSIPLIHIIVIHLIHR